MGRAVINIWYHVKRNRTAALTRTATLSLPVMLEYTSYRWPELKRVQCPLVTTWRLMVPQKNTTAFQGCLYIINSCHHDTSDLTIKWWINQLGVGTIYVHINPNLLLTLTPVPPLVRVIYTWGLCTHTPPTPPTTAARPLPSSHCSRNYKDTSSFLTVKSTHTTKYWIPGTFRELTCNHTFLPFPLRAACPAVLRDRPSAHTPLLYPEQRPCMQPPPAGLHAQPQLPARFFYYRRWNF